MQLLAGNLSQAIKYSPGSSGAKGGVKLVVDIITIVLGILLLIVVLGDCVLDWIEHRDEWFEMHLKDAEEGEDGKDGEGENNKL